MTTGSRSDYPSSKVSAERLAELRAHYADPLLSTLNAYECAALAELLTRTTKAQGCGACDKPGEHCARPYGICDRAAPEPPALRLAAERVRDHACTYGAPADSLLVKREIIGQLAQALGGSITEELPGYRATQPPSASRCHCGAHEWPADCIQIEDSHHRLHTQRGCQPGAALTKPALPSINMNDRTMAESHGDPRITGEPDETSAREQLDRETASHPMTCSCNRCMTG